MGCVPSREGAVALQAVHFEHRAIRSSGFRLVAKKRGIDSMVRSACLSFPFLPFNYLFPHSLLLSLLHSTVPRLV